MIMLLTETQSQANIALNPVTHLLEYSYKSMGRFEPRRNDGVGYTPLGVWLFLCPKSLLSTLKNPSLWWARLLVQLRYAAVQTNMNAHRPKIEPLRGGLSLNNGASHMTIHAQEPANTLNLSVSEIENQLIELSNIIGSVSGSNPRFTGSLSRVITRLGKPLSNLTTTELITIIEECGKAFNAGTEPDIERISFINSTLKYCVTFFQVVKPDNRALSARFGTYAEALEALSNILTMDAVISRQTVYFCDEDQGGRAKILAEIVKSGCAS